MSATDSQPRTMRRPARRRLVGLAIGAATTAVVVVALELGLRAAGFGPGDGLNLVGGEHAAPGALQFTAEHRDPRRGLVEVHPDRGYTLRTGYRSSAEHAGSYALGAWPWRGRPAEPAPPGIARVVVLGDSCAYGVGIETSQTLAHQLALELEERGLDRTRVQVLNLGVPGYSTVQVAHVLEWALRELEPDVAVFYVAAWNDGSSGTGRTDAEILASHAQGNVVSRSAIVDALRRAVGRGPNAGGADSSETDSSDESTVARVPAEEIEPRVRALVERARATNCPAIVVAPGHPAATEVTLPRVVPDRASVRRAARALAVPLVDVEEVALLSGRIDGELWVDFVHPSAALWSLVAPEVAERVAEELGQLPLAVPTELAVLGVERRTFSALGDERLAVELAGVREGDRAPVVLVGGAPLLDVRFDGDGVVSGTLSTNAAGVHDLVVQTERGVVIERAAIELVPPRLERAVAADGSVSVLVHSRPGDRAKLFVSRAALARPQESMHGTVRIEYAQLAGPPLDGSVGPDGTVAVPLPPEFASSVDPLWVQGLVLPAGEPDASQEARVTGLLAL
jgi:lysophospholipase L1-like esterase